MEVVLGLDSSRNHLSVALMKGNELLALTTNYSPMAALRYLMPTIEYVMRSANASVADLTLVAVTSGPGSWTGLRIGVETAKTIAQVQGIPMVGISTFDALAAKAQFVSRPVASVLDARKGRLHARLFDCSGSFPQLMSELRDTPAVKMVEQIPSGSLLVGDTGSLGLNEEVDRFTYGPAEWSIVDASMLCRLGIQKLSISGPDDTLSIVPDYMQIPGANEVFSDVARGIRC